MAAAVAGAALLGKGLDISLAALQQHDPYISSIVDVASQVALYTFGHRANEWVRETAPPRTLRRQGRGGASSRSAHSGKGGGASWRPRPPVGGGRGWAPPWLRCEGGGEGSGEGLSGPSWVSWGAPCPP